jgi:hypothetical protein
VAGDHRRAGDVSALADLLALREGLVRQIRDYLTNLQALGLPLEALGEAVIVLYFDGLSGRLERMAVVNALRRLRVFFRALRNAGVLPAGQDPLLSAIATD